MMKTPMLYGIPNCDTVRKARKWLDSHHVTHDFVDLRLATPSRERLSEWLNIVGKWQDTVSVGFTTDDYAHYFDI